MAISSLRQRLRWGFLSGQSRRPIPRKPRLEQLEDRTVLSGGRSGFFQAATVLFAAVNPHSVAVGDFNGDGKPDLAVAGSGTINVLLGNGDGTFPPSSSLARGSAYTGFNTLSVGDFGNGL